MSLTHTKRSIGAFFITLTIGSCGGLLFWILIITGRLRVHGYWRLMRQIAQGNTILAANHPTLLETVILPMMCWPWGVFWPRRFFPWSVPDAALFPQWLNWLYDVAHCVKVDRSKHGNHEAARLMQRILRSGGTLIVHPEAGRTASDFRGVKRPAKRYGHHQGRQLRRIQSGIPIIAREAHSTIIPLWVDIPFWKEANGFRRPLWLWIRRLERITISVGEPYQVRQRQITETFDRSRQHTLDNKELGSRILRAGLE